MKVSNFVWRLFLADEFYILQIVWYKMCNENEYIYVRMKEHSTFISYLFNNMEYERVTI